MVFKENPSILSFQASRSGSFHNARPFILSTFGVCRCHCIQFVWLGNGRAWFAYIPCIGRVDRHSYTDLHLLLPIGTNYIRFGWHWRYFLWLRLVWDAGEISKAGHSTHFTVTARDTIERLGIDRLHAERLFVGELSRISFLAYFFHFQHYIAI